MQTIQHELALHQKVYDRRRKAICDVGDWGFNLLHAHLTRIPRKPLLWGLKPGGDRVTELDWAINDRAIRVIRRKYKLPGDAILGEERALFPPAGIELTGNNLYIDPADGSNQLVKYDHRQPMERNQIGVLLCYSALGTIPWMFYAGYPLRGERYYGSLEGGVFLNGKPYFSPLPRRDDELLAGINDVEPRFTERLMTDIGLPSIKMANPLIRLVLERKVNGGLNWFGDPAESMTLAGAVRALGGIVTNLWDGEWQPGPDPLTAVPFAFSFPDTTANHGEILKEGRLRMR